MLMPKTVEQLQNELDREIAYTRKVNDKNAFLTEENKMLKRQLADSILKTQHEEIIAKIRKEYENKLTELNSQPPRIHNERGGGRKRIASKKIAARVLELSGQGLSQAKIAVKIADEFNMKIKRTTVGEIVRGNYKLPDAD